MSGFVLEDDAMEKNDASTVGVVISNVFQSTECFQRDETNMYTCRTCVYMRRPVRDTSNLDGMSRSSDRLMDENEMG